MPATRVTVALNKNQSHKAPLIIPSSAPLDPNASSSVQALVVKTAQSKLRLKKPARFFVARTADELLVEADWARCIRNDVIVLVSAGEEYVGVNVSEGKHGEFRWVPGL